MSIDNSFENGKIAVAIRSARTAVGWNQQEFAEKMGVAKSTIARIETLEMAAKGDFVNKAMRLFREAGVEVDLYDSTSLPINVKVKAIEDAIASFKDADKRRSDRGTVGLKRPTSV